MLALRHHFLSAEPASRLLRQVLLFSAVDIIFMSFAIAYAFSVYGLPGSLTFLAAQYALSTGGFFLAFKLMRQPTTPPLRVLRFGISGMLGGMLLAALHTQPAWMLSALAVGGFGRGMAWGGRQWLEMQVTRGQARESYLALLQSASTLFKLGGPLLAAAVLFWSSNSFNMLFLSLGLVGFSALTVLRDQKPLDIPLPGAARPLAALASGDYWKTAPFYLLEGAGSSLRQALFVSGTLTVVGSVAAYGVIDSVASLVAAGFLAWLAIRPKPGPSLVRLQYSLALVGLSWLLLLGALKLPVLLAAFVATYALGNPLLLTVKSSLVLKGLASTTSAPQDNALARELLLVSARLVALLVAAVLAASVVSKVVGLLLVVSLVLLLLPFEYLFARKLAQAPNL